MLSWLNHFTGSLFRVGSLIVLMAMTLIVGFDAIFRYALNMPIVGAYDIVGLGLLLMVLTTLPDSMRTGCHVRMDIFYSRFGPRLRNAVDFIATGAAVLFGGLVAYQAIAYIPRFYRTRSATITLEIPTWPFTALIAVSCLLFCLSAILNFAARATAASEE